MEINILSIKRLYKKKKEATTYKAVPQMFQNWNQIRASLEKWKDILNPAVNIPLSITTIGY